MFQPVQLENRKGRKERKEIEIFAPFAFFAVHSIQPHGRNSAGASHCTGRNFYEKTRSARISRQGRAAPVCW